MGHLICGGVLFCYISNLGVCFPNGSIAGRREIICRERLGGGL